MKNRESLVKSAKARLGTARVAVKAVSQAIERMDVDAPDMTKFRDIIGDSQLLLQCLHELSAYINAIHTE